MKRTIALLSAVIMFLSTSCAMTENAFAHTLSNENSAAMTVEKIDAGTEMIYLDDATIVDQTTADRRTITTVAGETTSEFVEEFATGMAYLYVDGELKETYDMNEIRSEIETWVMPEEDQALLDAFLEAELPQSNQTNALPELPAGLAGKYEMTYEDGGIVVTPVQSDGVAAASSSTKTVRPYKTVTSAYPTYMYKQIDSATKYSSVCGRNLSIKVKDSWYSYALISKTSKTFSAGTAISMIVTAFSLPTATVISSLNGLYSIKDGIKTLDTAVTYYKEESYNFHALRQGYVYDYTTNMRDVSVTSETGQGRVSMTWDYDTKNNCYINPQWKITAQAAPFAISTSTIIANAKQIWETNIELYGYWKHGDL